MKRIILLFFCSVFLLSCSSDYSPKPRGYFRINLPKKEYTSYHSNCNYSFKIPTYAKVWQDSSLNANACWKNIVFPSLNGRIHLSYFPISSPAMFAELVEDSRRLAFKHTVRAEGINESIIKNNTNNVHGLYYEIDGNTASAVQFFVTDSNKHFLRGALYFYAAPEADSLSPLINFVKKDIDVMLESLVWK